MGEIAASADHFMQSTTRQAALGEVVVDRLDAHCADPSRKRGYSLHASCNSIRVGNGRDCKGKERAREDWLTLDGRDFQAVPL